MFEIFDIDGNSIEKIVTDENGMATSSKLELGKYRIKEIKANDDYELNGKEYIADITKNDETVEIGLTNSLKRKNNYDKIRRKKKCQIYQNFMESI